MVCMVDNILTPQFRVLAHCLSPNVPELFICRERAMSSTAKFLTRLPKVIWKEGRVPALWHTYAVNSPLVTMVRPKFAPKVPLPVDRSPSPTKCLIPGPVRPMMPNGIRIRSAVLPQCTVSLQTDGPTHRQPDAQTDRSSTGKFEDYRPLRYESNVA